LARAKTREEQAQLHLTGLQDDLARACCDVGRTGMSLAAHVERGIAAARAAVLQSRAETDELRVQVAAAARQRQAAEALKTRRMAELSAREARKEERELDEANQA
jgi:hypothetical protein